EDERCRLDDAVDGELKARGLRGEREVYLLRINDHRALRQQPFRIEDGADDAITRVAFEVMAARRNVERATRHSGLDRSRMDVRVVEEVDRPGVSGRWKHTIFCVHRLG